MPYTGCLHVTLAKYFASTLTNIRDQRFYECCLDSNQFRLKYY